MLPFDCEDLGLDIGRGPNRPVAKLCLSSVFLFNMFNLYDKSRPENQTKLVKIDSFPTNYSLVWTRRPRTIHLPQDEIRAVKTLSLKSIKHTHNISPSHSRSPQCSRASHALACPRRISRAPASVSRPRRASRAPASAGPASALAAPRAPQHTASLEANMSLVCLARSPRLACPCICVPLHLPSQRRACPCICLAPGLACPRRASRAPASARVVSDALTVAG
jgi:hypothetical protein